MWGSVEKPLAGEGVMTGRRESTAARHDQAPLPKTVESECARTLLVKASEAPTVVHRGEVEEAVDKCRRSRWEEERAHGT